MTNIRKDAREETLEILRGTEEALGRPLSFDNLEAWEDRLKHDLTVTLNDSLQKRRFQEQKLAGAIDVITWAKENAKERYL